MSLILICCSWNQEKRLKKLWIICQKFFFRVKESVFKPLRPSLVSEMLFIYVFSPPFKKVIIWWPRVGFLSLHFMGWTSLVVDMNLLEFRTGCKHRHLLLCTVLYWDIWYALKALKSVKDGAFPNCSCRENDTLCRFLYLFVCTFHNNHGISKGRYENNWIW